MTHLASLTDRALRDAFAAALAAGDEALSEAAWAIFASRNSLDERGHRDPIVTYHAFPPIPVRDFDWQAHRDGDEGGEGLSGWGRTEAAAIADLVALEAERDEDAAYEAGQEAAIAAAERAEYERDEAADAKRQARIDDAADLARIADEDADVPDDWAFLPDAE